MKKKTYIIPTLMLIISLLFITYSIYNITTWKLDQIKTKDQLNFIEKETKIEEVEDNQNTHVINQTENLPINDPYFDYINMNLLNVDFKELKNINSDVIGWLQVSGTNINYPFVQANNNKYYLNHSLDKTHNTAGWLFLDYRNNDTNNKNTIIYAHGRTDKTMFGTLRKVLTNEWVSNTNNYVIRISTEKENTLWQIFSTYHIPTTSDYLQTEFNNAQEYQNFLDLIKNRSSHNFNVSITTTDNILTLSTCYSTSEKMVVHAKLIKKEIKEV